MVDIVLWLLDKLVKWLGLDERIPAYFDGLKKPRGGSRAGGLSARHRERINGLLGHLAVLHGPYVEEPALRILPRHPLGAGARELADRRREQLRNVAPNDPHALVVNAVMWADDPPSFHLRPIDYAELCALRALPEDGHPPRVLSANALVVCAETRSILLHRRAETSATYPSCLHTIGGGYWPPGIDGREGDGQHIRHTAVREVYEETRAAILIKDATPKVILEELSTGFVQVAFLGCAIDAEGRRHIQHNAEGSVVWLGFDELEERLVHDPDWVPTAKAAVLAWLAMAAPAAGKSPRFGKKRPEELFEAVMGRAAAPVEHA